MTTPSVDTTDPPEQEVELIARWGDKYSVRLENRGNGHAAVTMWVDRERKTVALVDYGATAATTDVRWNKTGTIALEQYKRDAWDTRIYSEIAEWLRGKAVS